MQLDAVEADRIDDLRDLVGCVIHKHADPHHAGRHGGRDISGNFRFHKPWLFLKKFRPSRIRPGVGRRRGHPSHS